MPDPIRVMVSYGKPRPTTNPYIVMLDDALRASPELEYHRFSWRTAFSRRYDVFHTHWTEAIMQARTRPRALGKQVALLLAVVGMRLRGVAIVQTVHNVERPDGLGLIERLVLRLVAGGTRGQIRINATTALTSSTPATTILHGDYTSWYARHAASEPVPGRVGYFGLVRRYKGTESLVGAVVQAAADDPTISLRLGGRASTTELADDLRSLAGTSDRVRLDLHFLDDAELVEIATESTLVVLPYRFMHNSGSLLAALSLHRPVLVPDNEANRALADEVGREWITFFEGELTAAALLTALRWARTTPRSVPDLSRRAWGSAAEQHVTAYRSARA